jgi:uncharacterized protein (DUF2141 family)
MGCSVWLLVAAAISSAAAVTASAIAAAAAVASAAIGIAAAAFAAVPIAVTIPRAFGPAEKEGAVAIPVFPSRTTWNATPRAREERPRPELE